MWIAAKIADHGGQRMGPVDIGVPVGSDDQQRAIGGRAYEMPQQPQRRCVRPMEIVEDQHHRRPLSGA